MIMQSRFPVFGPARVITTPTAAAARNIDLPRTIIAPAGGRAAPIVSGPRFRG
jgi:hypothetical protein